MKKGDRVLLKKGTYVPELSNPVMGSDYECIGTVTGTYNVLWDNGFSNTYCLKRDLILADDTENDFISVWQ